MLSAKHPGLIGWTACGLSIRENQKEKFLKYIEKLKARIQNGKLKKDPKIHQVIRLFSKNSQEE